MVKRINELIKDIDRNGLFIGIGKPEPLKYRKAYSRRITVEHRLVYNMDSNNNLIIYACKYHYAE
ncbi:MAG: Txe/YoeB family addiction module toxin [Lachnospiraceae bacterium]|nr:Txe/YoeB family addiction module toxin [Lachnospiraceae bacterium]